jgi:predicted extracellular nuclease
MRRTCLAVALFAAIACAVPASAAASDIVISELRFRGPLGGNDEFVELQNTGTAAVSIGGWQLIGCSATAPTGTRATVPDNTVLAAGGHYLFTNVAANGYSGDVPGDVTYTTGFGDTGGAQLTNGTAVIDAVGSTSTIAACKEGTGLTFPTASANTGFERTQDTGNNAADFVVRSPSDPQACGAACVVPEEVVDSIGDVQGSGYASPHTGDQVTLEGVVTGHDDEIGQSTSGLFPEDRGLFIQDAGDGDPATSDGLLVADVRDAQMLEHFPLGTLVRVKGTVREKFDQTILDTDGAAGSVEAIGTGTVPDPVTLDAAAAKAQTETAAGRSYYERFEGMRVRVAEGVANSGGTNKFNELFLTLGAERNRVFRTDAAPDLIATDSDAGAGNPPIPYHDADGSPTTVQADLFDGVTDLIGPMSYDFGNYRVVPQPGLAPVVDRTPGPAYPYAELQPAAGDQLRIASFNVENFFPVGGDLDGAAVTEEEYAAKKAAIVDAIANRLQRPDVVAVQEVYELAILQDVASDLGGYTAYLREGNDNRGIDVGFLIKDTVQASNVRQLGKTAPGSCSDVAGRLFDRPPLAVDIERNGVQLTVISNHFASKSAPESCRIAQAEFVRDRVAEMEAGGAEVLVAGDLNDFEDEPGTQALDATMELLWDYAPEQERYSYQFDGKLQTLDQMLVTDGLVDRVADFRYAHFDNDYYQRSATDGHHLSDHDPPVVTLDLPGAPVNTQPPSVSGTAKFNKTLTGTRGTWTVDEGEIDFAYQWVRCTGTDTATCTPIDGATALTYTVGKEDRDRFLRLRVTATSQGGETVAYSPPVAVR